MTVLSRLVQKRAAIVGSWQSMDPAAIPPNSASLSYAAGVVVNDQTALTLAAVFRAISIVSESVAQMDWASYRGVGTERKPVPNQPNVVLDPFVGVRRREGIAQIMVSLLLRGNAYLLITQRDPTLGWPLKVKIVHPDAITVRSANGVIQYFTGTNTQIPTENIVHIRGLTLPGMEVGVSPIDLAAQSFAVGIAAREFGSRFFAQGVNPSGVIETTDPIDEDEARRIAQRIQKAHGGSSNSHLPLILDAGMSWKTITLTPDQAQFLQTQDHSRSEVATWFGVPPHLLQDVSKTTSWGSGIEDQMIQYVTFTIRGWAQRIEEAWDTELLPRGNYARFDFESLLRANTLVRAQYYMMMRTIGALSVNEVRAMEDQPPVEGGDSYTQPMNAPTPQPTLSLAPADGAKDDSKG